MYPKSTSSPSRQILLTALLCILTGFAFGLLATMTARVAVVSAALLLGFAVASLSKAHAATQSMLYLVVITVVFTSAMTRGTFLPLLTPNELTLFLVLLPAFCFSALNRPQHPFPGLPLVAVTALIAGTVIAPVLSYPLRNVSLTPSYAVSYLAPLQYVGLLWLFSVLPRTREHRGKIVQLLIFCASVVALVGVLQAFKVTPVLSFLEAWYPSEQLARATDLSRATSVFGAWNVLGMFTVANIFLVAAVYPYESRRLYRANMQVAGVTLLLCLLATNLYSGFFALLLGAALLRLLDSRILSKRVLTTGAAAIGVGIALLLPGLIERYAFQTGEGTLLFQTLQYRVNIWVTDFLPLIKENLWWGVSPSFESLPFAFPESQYIYLLIRSGLVGLLAHLTWIGILLVWLSRVYRRGRPSFERSLAAVAITQLVTFSLVGMINPVFTYSGSIDMLWIVLGLIVSAERS